MSLTLENQTANETFFHPLKPLVAGSIHTSPCREVSDEQYVLLGVQRVLEGSASGRAFLLELRMQMRPSVILSLATILRTNSSLLIWLEGT